MLDEGPEANHQCFSWGQVFFQPHPIFCVKPVEPESCVVTFIVCDDVESIAAEPLTISIFVLAVLIAPLVLTITRRVSICEFVAPFAMISHSMTACPFEFDVGWKMVDVATAVEPK